MRASREEAGGEDDTEAEAEADAAAPAPAAAASAPVSAAAAMFRRASGSPNASLTARGRGRGLTFGADVAATEVEVNARRPTEGSSSDAPIAVEDVGVVGDGDGAASRGRVSSGGVGARPRRADQTIERVGQTRQRGSRGVT